MHRIERGHAYGVNNLDGGAPYAVLTFVKREGPKYPGNVGHHPGTTTQEVLRACLDRSEYVYRQIPCWQTWTGIRLLRLTIWLFEHRAARRHGRRPPSVIGAVYGTGCEKCGHVGCWGECHE